MRIVGIALPLALCAGAAAQEDFFEKQVRPILATRCQGCHNTRTAQAGLDLSSAAGFQKGADTGRIVMPGVPEKSRLLQVTGYQERIKMPPTGRLSDRELTVLREWVLRGASWPPAPVSQSPQVTKRYGAAQGEVWSFRPLRRPLVPAVKNSAWVQSPIDSFVLAALESNEIAPAPPADRLTWIHRVTLDLTGLPPSEAEIAGFLQDPSQDSFARVVDRLLASPRYGEKWGRHWLDVARYADSTGADEDYRYPHAWRYRDYVIDAFNRDLPYDQFVREQVAGDLLPPPAGDSVNAGGIVATGFLALGPKLLAEQDKVKMFYDIVDEQIDVTGKAFLGLTLACARCHDHKFDPISIRDYYSLASIFASTKQLAQLEGTVSKLYYAPLTSKEETARYEAYQGQIANKQKEIDAVVSAEAIRYRDERAPLLAQSMLAARRVYAGGVAAPEAAKAAGLDEALVQRWADYLKPTGERRVHLERWYQAPPAVIESVAGQYQAAFLAEIARRSKTLEEHRVQAAAAEARGEKPPPAPKFPAGENRFYTEVAAGKGPLTLPAKDAESVYSEVGRRKVENLKADLEAIKKAAPAEPPFACAVGEDQAVEQHVFLRGNPEAKGEAVTKRFPTILAGEDQKPIHTGSGRLELAHWLASAENPLTARVMVNRIWQGHFGQGLVRTPNNFGVAGDRPTHPELLDWLASEFIQGGWSVKKMHRLVVLSSTYRMSSASTDAQRQKDPGNLLLSRFSLRRKTVEEIRDSLLLLDGSLDLTMHGSLQKGEGTDNEFSDGRKSIHPDSTNRRTVYLPIRRSNLSTLFTLFDFGDGTTSTDVRAQTNVAPQALYMMNSNFVAERARGLAVRLLQHEGTDEQRVRLAWRKVLGREPGREEIEDGVRFVTNFPAGPGGAEGRLLAWTGFCRSLVATNDFIYVY